MNKTQQGTRVEKGGVTVLLTEKIVLELGSERQEDVREDQAEARARPLPKEEGTIFKSPFIDEETETQRMLSNLFKIMQLTNVTARLESF